MGNYEFATDVHRSLGAIQGHLAPVDEVAPTLVAHPTAAVAEAEHEYSVALPERLTATGPWLVHR